MAHDRELAGIRCLEVLARLSEYVDGELSDAERARVAGHLRGCDWCARFGGGFQTALAALPGAVAASRTGPDAGRSAPVRRLLDRAMRHADGDD